MILNKKFSKRRFGNKGTKKIAEKIKPIFSFLNEIQYCAHYNYKIFYYYTVKLLSYQLP